MLEKNKFGHTWPKSMCALVFGDFGLTLLADACKGRGGVQDQNAAEII